MRTETEESETPVRDSRLSGVTVGRIMAGVLSGGMCSLQNQDAQAEPARKAPLVVTQVVEPLSCHRDGGNPETVLAEDEEPEGKPSHVTSLTIVVLKQNKDKFR